MKRINITSYVWALKQLGEETNNLKVFYQNTSLWLSLILENPKIIDYLSDLDLPLQERRDLIKEVDNNSSLFNNFLFLLLDERKIRYLKEILSKFLKLVNKEKGIIEGEVYTTIVLQSTQLEKIEQGLSKKIGKEVKLRPILDKEIVGGIKVVLEEKIWDYTLSNQIKELAKEMIIKQGEN